MDFLIKSLRLTEVAGGFKQQNYENYFLITAIIGNIFSL